MNLADSESPVAGCIQVARHWQPATRRAPQRPALSLSQAAGPGRRSPEQSLAQVTVRLQGLLFMFHLRTVIRRDVNGRPLRAFKTRDLRFTVLSDHGPIHGHCQ